MREKSREDIGGFAARTMRRSLARPALALGLLLTGCIGREPASAVLTPAQRAANAAACDEVWATVRDRHWDPDLGGVDWDGAHAHFRPQAAAATTMADARCVMRAMLARLGCSHFAIIPGPHAGGGAARAASGNNNAFGSGDEPLAESSPAGATALVFSNRGETGVDLRMIDRRVTVVDVTPNSPADQAGIRPGWIIERVDGRQVSATVTALTRQYPQHAARDRVVVRTVLRALSGTVGQTVAVDLLTGDGHRVRRELRLAAARGRCTQFGLLPPAHVWWERRMLDDAIVYFRMNAFHDPQQVLGALADTVEQNSAAAGFILDLRGNGGGVSAMARGVAGWFVADPHGYLGTMRLRDTVLKLVVATRLTTYRGPLAVLVDEFSASTAEILASGLRDLGRARVFGTPTAATALPSRVMQLANGDLFQFAVGDYVSAGGQRIEGVGVQPDEVVRNDRDTLLAGRDAVIEAACRWIACVQDPALIASGGHGPPKRTAMDRTREPALADDAQQDDTIRFTEGAQP